MKRLFKATILIVCILIAGFPNAVFAQDISEQVGSQPTRSLSNPLGLGKLKSCQAKERTIKKRSEKITIFSSNVEKKFDSIASRVKDYYVNNVVPSGKIVSNYDSLVANIDIKKTVVQALVTKAQNDASTFSCESANPKAQLMEFKDDMKAVKAGLKEYRSSIKDLIVAVRSVTGEENNLGTVPNPSQNPKPSKLHKRGELNNGKQK